jgi:HSP20 family protein
MPEKRPVLWDPVKEVVEDFEDTFNHLIVRPNLMRKRLAGTMIFPDLDFYEQDNKIIVKADIPGMTKEDIHVKVDRDILTIRGERKKEERIKDESYSYCERFYGAFSRTVKLPSEVDKNKVTANYKNGTLIIEMPRIKEMLAKEIDIKVD